jgi:hypothetical protein
MTTRNDIHSPANFDPAQYRYVDMIWLGNPEEGPENDPETLKMIDLSSFRGNFANKSTCDHCGAWFLYGAVFEHQNGDVIVVGNQCATQAFGFSSRREVDLAKARKAVQLAKERSAKAKAVKAFLEAHPGLDQVLELEHPIIQSISSQLIRWGKISDKQVALVHKLAADMQKPKVEEPKIPVVAGRRQLTGKIVSSKVQDGPYGSQIKILLICEDGQKLWGTCPSGLLGNDPVRGQTVRFTATVEVSPQDPCFGFFKRPTNPERLDKPVQVQ